nr:immunoglobulin light chain junction region [Macaca mulatta]
DYYCSTFHSSAYGLF